MLPAQIIGAANRGALDAASGPTDPYWASVVLLAFNENGADTTTTFTDQSTTAATLSTVGNAAWTNANPPTGLTTTGAFDGAGDRVTAPANTAYDLPGDFTVEGMLRWNTVTTDKAIYGPHTWGGSTAWGIYLTGSSVIHVTLSGSNRSSTFTPIVNTWYHHAVVRSGTTIKHFIDGVQKGTDVTDAGTASASVTLAFGSAAGGNVETHCQLGSIRITKGVARYTVDFTPPTLPLPTS